MPKIGKTLKNTLKKKPQGRPKKNLIKDEIHEEQELDNNFTCVKIEFKKHLVEL